MVKSPKKSTGHSKSKSKTLRPSTLRQKTFIIATQKLPLVVGKFIWRWRTSTLKKYQWKSKTLFFFPLVILFFFLVFLKSKFFSFIDIETKFQRICSTFGSKMFININFNKYLNWFLKIKQNTSNSSKFSAHFYTFNIHGGRCEHMFATSVRTKGFIFSEFFNDNFS